LTELSSKNDIEMNEQDREGTYTPNIESRSRNNYYHGKAISITYSECVSVA